MSEFDFDVVDYVRTIVSPMVEHPSELVIEGTQSDSGNITTVEIFVGGSDYGKVVGKEGRTFKAIQTILGVVEWNNRKNKVHYILRLSDIGPF